MASISDIRFHIKSINQTRQITNAMYLVSASRMRKAIKRIEQNSAYYYKALDTMLDIRAHTGEVEHPYLVHRPGQPKMGYIIIAGDKGLAGSYNHDILAFAEETLKGKNVTQIITVGDVATRYFKCTGREVNARFENMMTDLSVDTSRALMALIKQLYDQRVIDEVHIIYMRFINSARQKPKDFKLLPIELADFGADHQPREDNIEMLYDPSPERVFDALVPQFMIGVIYGTMVHAYASENSARMSAMENATHSADKLIKKLTLQYNSVRQLAITSELNEIVSAANVFNEKDDHSG